ncbi:peptidase M, neutral zinc metallopeptidases, zinc-binding site [Thiobacillus denitrificans ATCC 25259]|uniref:Aminopeptidase N n=1 Tax=Thiobacillus denitrificans (strain ATCC 25259 / T1) TaxID=292415 RepID=Q3SKD3_THIDA|nr:aminopeptidase N [Thiobacillus denitrificans]AAZ96852.1 peptidase M, neutral zinc metallopeptidases, zinc-binding site [Thiobacillus denitrificans ATCC 25259]
MRTETPVTLYLKDYAPPAWRIESADLHVAIHDDHAEVRARLDCVRNTAGGDDALVLNGEALELVGLSLDGAPLDPARYVYGDDLLRIAGPLPDRCVLESVVRIRPDLNTQLSGLYRSQDGYFTQCEPEGFRRITFFPDRPDVMTKFSCTVEADRARFPHLLSNGNPVAAGVCDDDAARHWARWDDPYAKPCYLFALVAARLDVLEDEYVTASGRKVRLAVYVEPGKLDQCGHAMAALKKAMRWDEERFGLEYDLDQYMIVAVGDFNMGAMENKGLNIFNTKYVLARPDTATDADYQGIDRVVAHEYFHNWTGNRVTCRDWFQLSLKEGLTVFRDQEFGADTHSRAVTRIQEVRALRVGQFPEDVGPMAHPIRPASYAEINNFYTATVYNKGAEVIRMMHTLLGREAFRRGTDLYFARHDGQAVTCEDFVAAMQDASGIDLAQFRRWYARAGTPRLNASSSYDATTRRYTLTLTQTLAPTAYEKRLTESGQAIVDGTLHIPVALGLVLPNGNDAPLKLAGEAEASGTTRVLSLTEPTQTFVFEDIPAAPVASLLRDFSAPVQLEFEQTDAELAHLMAHDDDAFNRWEAGQRLATRVLLAGIAAQQRAALMRHTLPHAGEDDSWRGAGSDWIPDAFVAACGRVLDAGLAGDPALAAEALNLPAEAVLAEAVVSLGQPIDPEAIHAARVALRRHLAARLRDAFEAAWAALTPTAAYAPDGAQVGQRALRNACLGYLAESDVEYLQSAVVPRLTAQLAAGGNMTDGNMTSQMAALATLANLDLPEREATLADFYTRWQNEALVVDKWFAVQATSRLPGTAARVRALMQHPAFDLKNPNRVYALIRGFCGANPRHFHAFDGSGYALAADVISELQAINPQVASRIARSFDRWRQFDAGRQAHARVALERIAEIEDLAKDVAEVVGNALKG